MMPVRHRTFFPPSPLSVAAPNPFGAQPKSCRRNACHYSDWPKWEVVSSYSSATAPDSHGISCADPLFQTRKELRGGVATCARYCKNYLLQCHESPTQRYDTVGGCQRFFLLCESLQDPVAFFTRSDRAGDISKIIRGVLLDDAAENFLKLRAHLSSRVQFILMILSPSIQRLGF